MALTIVKKEKRYFDSINGTEISDERVVRKRFKVVAGKIQYVDESSFQEMHKKNDAEIDNVTINKGNGLKCKECNDAAVFFTEESVYRHFLEKHYYRLNQSMKTFSDDGGYLNFTDFSSRSCVETLGIGYYAVPVPEKLSWDYVSILDTCKAGANESTETDGYDEPPPHLSPEVPLINSSLHHDLEDQLGMTGTTLQCSLRVEAQNEYDDQYKVSADDAIKAREDPNHQDAEMTSGTETHNRKLKIHRQKNCKQRRMWCKICDKFYKNIQVLKDHIRNYHGRDDTKVNQWNYATWDLEIARTFDSPS